MKYPKMNIEGILTSTLVELARERFTSIGVDIDTFHPDNREAACCQLMATGKFPNRIRLAAPWSKKMFPSDYATLARKITRDPVISKMIPKDILGTTDYQFLSIDFDDDVWPFGPVIVASGLLGAALHHYRLVYRLPAHPHYSETLKRIADYLFEGIAEIGTELPALRPRSMLDLMERVRTVVKGYQYSAPLIRAAESSVPKPSEVLVGIVPISEHVHNHHEAPEASSSKCVPATPVSVNQPQPNFSLRLQLWGRDYETKMKQFGELTNELDDAMNEVKTLRAKVEQADADIKLHLEKLPKP